MFYGKKNLLEFQLGIISIIKKIKSYHRLRHEELILKIHLKKKIDEAKNALKILDKILPKGPKIKKEKVEKIIPKDKHTEALEVEIESIRDKLSRLQQ